MVASLLFVGDIHLGRRPARLPDDLEDSSGLSPAKLTPAAAWREIVHHACGEGVDAVILAGDVVEAENAMFEAFGRLRQGVDELVEAGIQVFAVAGNHDVVALPRLAALIPDFRLLGRGGQWESAAIKHDGKTVAHILGWSFPATKVATSPLRSHQLPALPKDGTPCFGVVHADMEGGRSSYAPVTRMELESTDLDGWFLGHIHKPSPLQSERPIGYLGSLVGLDPTETGPHGPWLMRLGGAGRFELEQIMLAPLRWEQVTVAVDHLESAGELFELLVQRLDRLHDDIAAELGDTKAVGCRIELTGATAHNAALRVKIAAEQINTLSDVHDEVFYFVDKVIDHSRPVIDLQRCATEDDPPALLARLVIALEEGGEEAAVIVHRARREIIPIVEKSSGKPLELGELDDGRMRELLIDAGLQALEALLKQAASRQGEDGPA